jgi:hypothetical protein
LNVRMTKRPGLALVGLLLVVAGLIYLRDPAWLGSVTSGLGGWQGPPGARFRWTSGHASFFVPSDTTALTLPLKAGSAATSDRPVTVAVSVDDRWLATIELPDPAAWLHSTLPLPRKSTSRRVRRIDLRVDRTLGPFSQGVQLGEITFGATDSRAKD